MAEMEKPTIEQEVPLDPREMEREVQFILDQHPAEIANRWENDTQDLPLRAQLLRIRVLAQKRRDALAPKPYESQFLTILDSAPPEVEELFGKRANQMVEDMSEVDRGWNGRIMAFDEGEGNPDEVYKVLIRPPVGKQNDLMSEASYQADMHSIAITGAASALVPKVNYLATRSNARIIAMERVPGYSIKAIIDKKISVPANFDINAAQEACMALVEKFHTAGISHNDLRTGNIMLNLEKRKGAIAYVVDAGNAGRLRPNERSKDKGLILSSFYSLRTRVLP